MPATPPEAIARKTQRKNERRRAAKAAVIGTAPIVTSMNRKWRIGPRMPEMSKAELRAMFETAAKNTAAL